MPHKKSFPTDNDAKKQLLDIGRRMYEKGYVVTNDGNISVKVSDSEIWVTPSGVSKGFMTKDSLVKMDIYGNIIKGGAKPSSEIKMHLRVYRENPEVNAVVHAHPVAATTFAIAGIPLDLPIMLEASVQLGSIPVARYAQTGTEALADSIAPFCKEYAGVLLSNHGALTWADSLVMAYHRLEVMENYAQITMNLMSIGKMRLLSKDQMAVIEEVKRGFNIRGGVAQTGIDIAENLTDVMPGRR